MQNRHGLHSTMILINFHCHTHGENAVSKSTVNLAFRRLQPKITQIQKIELRTNNEGNQKEARH